MKTLWAPWRMEYILADKSGECVLCPGEDRSRDEERLILYVGERVLVIMNKYPYTNGHLMVAPIRHVGDLEDLSREEMLDLMSMLRKVTGILREQMGPDGFNVGLNLGRVAGAGMEDHLHFHVVPRWDGDTNFMTVFAEVRVIPEHIKETYNKLRPYFDRL
ncbi:MAG: HIT family protein [Desulfobacteraceae bacterium]